MWMLADQFGPFMASPFRFKYQLPPQGKPSTPLSARNFILSNRPSSTPAFSLPSGSQVVTDDIDDSYAPAIPRKRKRYASFHDLSSDEDDELSVNLSVSPTSTLDTPVTKRPPVILPQPTPESPKLDFSPSRRKAFQPNGLAAYTAKIIHEHSALSSVVVPRLDAEESVTIEECKMAEGEVGRICRLRSSEGNQTVALLLTPKGLPIPKEVKEGELLSISSAVKLETLWICTSWRHNSV
jgi:hypothetical protein